MTESPLQLKVVTFNLWGIFNSKMREERMEFFASKVEHYDIMLLQEQFDPTDFALIQEKVPEEVRKTRYFRRFPSGFYGSGCAVISRFPIRSTFFHIYPLQGYPEMILQGDFFANKGVAMVKVDVPVERNGALVNQEVTLYTTHLVAVYQKVSQLTSWRKERYLPYRISQAISLAEFIVSTSKPTDYIIVGGDFNSSQRSLEVQMMLILLKRKGYRMQSVLPAPGSVLEVAKTEEELELGRSLFTYSYRNAFNASKTSYFKMLKLEADIPSQIDHIFFNSAAFTLRTFEDCPDIAPGFPTALDTTGTGKKSPCGVVVFTKNEVVRSWGKGLLGTIAGLFQKSAKGKDDKGEVPSKPSHGAAVSRYPMSDHFGVAARLEMHAAVSQETRADSGNGQHGTDSTAASLTEEERVVVNNVVQFLDFFAGKMRHQVAVTRVMAGVSLAIITANVFLVRRLMITQERRTAAALRQLYHMNGAAGSLGSASAGAADSTASGPGSSAPSAIASATAKLMSEAKKWSNKAIDATHLSRYVGHFDEKPSPSAPAGESSSQPAVKAATAGTFSPDFNSLARELCLRPFWAGIGTSSLITAVASIVSTGSFAIGMFQRLGNANLFDEQVRHVRAL